MFFALVVNTHSLHGAGTKIFLLERKTQNSQEFCEVLYKKYNFFRK